MLDNIAVQLGNSRLDDVPQIAQRDDLAADMTQLAERFDELQDVLESLVVNGREHLLCFLGDLLRLPGRVLLDANDFLEFIHGRRSGFLDPQQDLLQFERLRLVQPEVRIDNVLRELDHFDIQIGVAVLFVDQIQQLVTFGHGSNDVPIADLVQHRIGVGARHVVFAHVRRLPDLNGMVLLSLFLGLEAGQFARLEQREAVADQRSVDALLDQVVTQQNVGALFAICEHIQVVLTVWRSDSLDERRFSQVGLERLVFATLQVVAIGENQSLIVGQQDTRVGDGVDAASLLSLLVVNNVAKRLLLVRTYFEQDRVTDDRVVDFGIVQRLVRIVYVLGVNPLAGLRVVLDLDRQIASDGFDK